MIIENIRKQIKNKRQGKFIYPCYEDFSFSNIPSAILYLFGLQENSPLSGILGEAGILGGAGITSANSRKVVLFLIDGFGYRQWLQYAHKSIFLKQLIKKVLSFR